MNSSPEFPVQLKWSGAEKKIARRAYDSAFAKQCSAITENAMRMLAKSSPPYGVWELHDYLSRERRKVDRTYDYRYSALISVFGELLREGWLTIEDLAGLSPDKLRTIESWANL